jgi:type II secretory pathway pseudopilin PulG
MNKRAQNPGQIFIYVLTVVIIGVIFLFGYQSIMRFKDTSDQITEVQFQKKLEGQITSLTSEYGTYKTVPLLLSGDYKEVCFVRNYENIGLDPNEFNNYPLIKDAVHPVASATGDNIFLLMNNQQIGESFQIGQIAFKESTEYLHCTNVTERRIQIGIEGRGNHVIIS